MRKLIKHQHYEFDKPPKGYRIKQTLNGIKYFDYINQKYYKTEYGWLPEDICSNLGLGQLGEEDYLIERVGF